MKIGRFLKYFAGAVVVLLVAAVVVLAAVDFNDYKPELQAQVKQATGRDLTIEGDIKLALSLTPSLGVSGVRFANADWGSRPAMATVDRFEVQVALIPLISGTIDIQHVLLKGADILLETQADGRANYLFEKTESDKPVDTAAPAIPVLRKVLIEDARVGYHDGASGKNFAVAVRSLALSAGGVDDAIEMTLAAAFNDNPVAATGTLGSRNDLLAAGKPYPVKLALEAGGAKIAVNGAVTDPLKAPKLDISVSVAGDSLEQLSPLAGAALPALGPYAVKGQLKGDPSAKLTLSDFAAKNVEIGLHLKGDDLRVAPLKAVVSEGSLDGALRLNTATATPALDTQIEVSKFDAGKFLTDMAITDLLGGRFNAKLDLKSEGKSVRALMAGLNGRTQLAMGEGKMKSTALDTFVGGPTKVLAGLFSDKQSEFTKINCMVSQFDIKGGLATSKALLFDTEFVSISGKGTVNLGSEALDLTVDPQPKSATLNTAVPVEITGTLAEPSFSPSTAAAARKVGGLLGAFVFPPALIIGLAETGTGEDNPCLKGGKAKPAAQQASPELQQAALEKADDPNPIAQPLKSIEKGVGGVLKKLFGN